METLEPKLESLIMTKAFSALNAEERLYVTVFLTEEKYNAYHFILKHTLDGAQDLDDTLLPAATIPAKLKTHFDEMRKPATGFSISAKHLSIAACIFLMVSLGVVLFKADKPDKPQVVPIQTKIVSTPVIPQPPQSKEKSINPAEKPVAQKPVSNAEPAPQMKIVKQEELVEEPDSLLLAPEELYGLHVQEPLLGLEVEVDDHLLGLHISVSNN